MLVAMCASNGNRLAASLYAEISFHRLLNTWLSIDNRLPPPAQFMEADELAARYFALYRSKG